MGVPGLWRLLEPAREPIDLQQLSGKIVAIDMNIWLHQAVKSRGASGGPRNYLAIFFRRLCKLLFFGIRPVFVFDGDTPALKRATIHTRRQLRNSAEAKAEKAQKHLLRRLLRRVAESEVGSSNVSTNGTQPPENLAKEELLRRLKQQSNFLQAMEDAEIFSAPSNQSISSDNKGSGIMLSENAGLEYDELARDFLDGFYSSDRKLSGMDLNSDAFCSLPLPAQLRVVQLAREILDTSSCRRDLIQRNNEASFDPETFSDVQTKRLLLRRRLAERQQELSDNLTKQEAVQQVLQLDNSMIKNILKNQSLCSALSTESTETIATAMRIQSQDVGHAILLKQSPLKKSNSLSKLPSSTTFDLEKLIALNPIELNASINNEEVECTKEASSLDASLDGTKDLKKVSNVELPSNDVCSPKQLQIPVNEQNIIEESITDSKCYSFDEQSTISESLNKKQMEDESEKEANISDNFNKVDQTIIINNNNSSENVLVVSASQDSFSLETEKLPIKPESPVFESLLCDHNNIRRDESNLNSNLSQQIHEVDDVKDFEDTQQNNEMNSDEDDDDDDFIEVETHEHVDLSNISSESTILQKYSTDKSSSHEESESTYTHEESESFDKETVEDSNIKEYISSSDLEDDDLIVDDNMLREKADRLTRQAQSTTTRCISEAQDLLRLFGFPFVVSPEEAEAQCVALQRYGLVDLVASDDSDVWPFGVRLVCRHLFGTGDDKKRRTNPSLYKLDEVKRKLGLTVENILRLTLLCGSDYTHGIDQVGPVTAIEILSEFGEVDDSLNTEMNNWLHGKCKPSEELLQNILKPLEQFTNWWQANRSQDSLQSKKIVKVPESSPVRRRWINLKPSPGFPDGRIARAYLYPNVKTDIPPFEWELPRVPLLVKHVNASLGWSAEKTEALLASVLKHRQTMEFGNPEKILSSKPLITNFFPVKDKMCKNSETNGDNVDASELDEVSMPSKRVRRAANRLRTKKADNQSPCKSSITLPSCSTSIKDKDNSLSELPKPRKSKRKQTAKNLPEKEEEAKEELSQVKSISNKKCTKKSQKKSQRRVVERVCLSEEDD